MKTLATALYVLAAIEVFKTLYLGRKIKMATQAASDLQKFIADLTTAVSGVASEFTALLTIIKNNNGVNPGAIETQVTAGEALVAQLNAAVSAAQTATNPPVVVVSVSPTSATLAVGATQQFTATVTGATDTSVKWGATTGTVDANGLYTAPSPAGTDTVTATSNEDATKSGSASVVIS
jgi:uncharacterized protein YjdB